MMLGRRLREEGITSSQIEQYQSKLVSAMKATLAGLSHASASPSSFYTAREFSYASSDPNMQLPSNVVDSASLLSCPPPQGSCIPVACTGREPDVSEAWEEASNLSKGVSSLLEGMQSKDEDTQQDDLQLFEFDEEDKNLNLKALAGGSYGTVQDPNESRKSPPNSLMKDAIRWVIEQ